MSSHNGFDPEGIVDMIEAARRMEANRCAPPDGGPATRLGDLGAPERPPAVT